MTSSDRQVDQASQTGQANQTDRPDQTDRADQMPRQLPAQISLIVAVFLTGLFAGFFVTYEISVTRGLAEVDDLTYVETFQWINATVLNLEFFVIFFVTVPALVAALVLNRGGERLPTALLASALVMALATVVITVTGNVPLNNELAEYETLTPEIARTARVAFEEPWNRLNLVRTLTAVVAAVCVTVAVVVRPVR